MKYKVGDEFKDPLGGRLKIVSINPDLTNCYNVKAKFGDYWHNVGFYNEHTFDKKSYKQVSPRANHPLTKIFQ